MSRRPELVDLFAAHHFPEDQLVNGNSEAGVSWFVAVKANNSKQLAVRTTGQGTEAFAGVLGFPVPNFTSPGNIPYAERRVGVSRGIADRGQHCAASTE